MQLQDLIQINLDSSKGFREAAEEISEDDIAKLFRGLAEERANHAEELQTFVAWNGEKAADDGSLLGCMHRAWVNVRAKLNGGDPYVVLIEAERGEDSIKEAYEEALKSTAGSAMNDVLLKQYACVKAGHDGVRDLRDAYKND